MPTSVTVQSFAQSSLSYSISEAKLSDSFSAWTTTPSACELTYIMTITPPMIDPGLIVFDDTTLTLKLHGTDIYYGGDQTTGTYIPGTYSVLIKSQADNPLVDTGVAHTTTISVTIRDPCD